MAALSSPRLPRTESKPKRSSPIGRQPLMLKDFLSDNSNSCSSNGFRSFPRQPTVRHILEFDFKADNIVTSKLLRSRSRAASTTISAIHKASEIVIKAVRHLPFASVKSPSVLPRSVSRRLLKREFWKKCRNDDVGQISVTVRVKDILRWRSFRDLVEELQPPLDSPFWSADAVGYAGVVEREVAVVKKCLPEFGVGRDSMEATTGETVEPKGELLFEEKELHSPVSVHDFPFEEDEGSFSSCHQSLANMESMSPPFFFKVVVFLSCVWKHVI
ncbi:hypothetical protein F0562_014827 [Nyssa sinensis]|uniref:Uncharacterized protein n=1 Tax=Nyssa sinensis TaxID=561372 RepID=A0A5J4ZTZ2_9ASTE|nr:hypothetical protein F0562_014827 [Nyssa sinensis]